MRRRVPSRFNWTLTSNMAGALCDVGSSVAFLSDVRISGRNLFRVLLLYVVPCLVLTVPWPQRLQWSSG